MEKQERFTVGNLASLLSVLIGIHYYLSYRWLYGLLRISGIEFLSIITIEDLTFPFANVNTSIIFLAVFAFIGIFCWILFGDENFDLDKTVADSISPLKNWLSKWGKWTRITGTFTPFILIAFYVIFFGPKFSYPDNAMVWYFAILFGGPILFMIVDLKKRHLIVIVQSFALFVWAITFIDIALEKAKYAQNETNSYLDFTYKNKKIVTSDSLMLLFHGSKYLILSKRNGEVQLYDTKNIDGINIVKRAAKEKAKK